MLFEIERANIHRTSASVNSNEWRNTMEINNNEFITSLCIMYYYCGSELLFRITYDATPRSEPADDVGKR